MISIFGFTVKNLQTMEGREGYVMRGKIAEVRENGRAYVVAEFFDDGNGGMTDFDVTVPIGFVDMQTRVMDGYSRYGVKAGAPDGFVSPFDFLVDDYMLLTDSLKGAKKVARKNKWDKCFLVVYVKDGGLGASFDCVAANSPITSTKALGKDAKKIVGSFDISGDIVIK